MENDKLFLCLGAGPGIGLHTALRFAREGFHPVLAARRADKLEELAGTLREATGREVTTVSADMADSGQISALAERFGAATHVLHYNAAVLRAKAWHEVTADGETVALIGANGAGKSSALRAVSGLQRIASGEISFGGQRIDGIGPDKIVQKGIVQVPEGRQIFTRLTVEENLRMGAYVNRDRADAEKNYETALNLFPILKERAKQSAGTLWEESSRCSQLEELS